MTDSKQIMRNALKQIKKLKQQLSVYQKMNHEPIAVVGMGCRFPDGADSPQIFWEKLVRGDDFINPHLNNERWDMDRFFDEDPDAPGKLYCKSMGLLDGLDKFDTEFFGISPREAEDIDPQHRLLLEVSYETMEYAGYSPNSLAGSNTGVYVGIASSDYAHLGSILGKPEQITPWQGIGNAMSAAPGRLSYLYNFKGPAVAFDTACSSSLVAVHHACTALRQGECDYALAGGVHLVLNPAVSIVFAKARMLSPDGHCKTFDKNADGYVRSEGCGMLMLKRLSDAECDGDQIIGLIKGSAINQDGKSQGFTAPNETAQVDVIQKALKQAQVEPASVDYIEAHGTGTPLGDPIELNALNQAYCQNRQFNSPLIVGSVKTNMGHAEAASGSASLIKMLLSLQHQYLPKHLHFDTPNPFVAWNNMPIKVNSEGREWGSDESIDTLRCGVSGFAFTGTNAHVILESYAAHNAESPDSLLDETDSNSPVLLISSATKPSALQAKRKQLTEYLSRNVPGSITEIAASLAKGKDHFKYREAFVGGSIELIRQSWNQDVEKSADYFFGEKKKQHQKLCLVLPSLDESALVFWESLSQSLPSYDVYFKKAKSTINELCESTLSDIDTREAINSSEIDNFIGQLAFASLWQDWGLKTDCLIGRDFGELIAAYMAGVFNWNDACELALIKIIDTKIDKLATQDINRREVQFQKPRLRLLSQFTGEHAGKAMSDYKYWLQTTANVVNCGDYLESLETQGIDIVFQLGGNIEIGSSILSISCIANQQGLDSLHVVERALAQLYVSGLDFNWAEVYTNVKTVGRPLPTYPFQRKHCWNPVLENANPFDAKATQHTALDSSFIYSLGWNATSYPMPLSLGSSSNNPLIDSEVDDNWLLLYPASFNLPDDIGDDSIKYEFRAEAELQISNIERAIAEKKERITSGPLNIVLSFVGMESQDYIESTGVLLDIAQLVRRIDNTTLSVLTQNGVCIDNDVSDRPQHSIQQSALYGAIKSLALELPERFRLGLDIDEVTDFNHQLLKKVQSLVTEADLNPWLVLRKGTLFEPKVNSESYSATTHSDPKIDDSAFYLIAGGTGSIGLSVAKWLALKGAKHIVLMSRSGATTQRCHTVIKSLEEIGVRVLLPQVDIADSISLEACLASLRSERDIKGVFHTAGKFDLTPLQELTKTKCSALMDNKVLGMHWLDQLTRSDALDYFVGFSSIAAVWGSAGNFHYAAANHVVDSVINYRREQGLPGIVINWGPWEDSGMVSESSKVMAEKRGLRTLDHDTAIAAFEYLLLANQSEKIVVDVDWSKFKPLMSLTSVGKIFSLIRSDSESIDSSNENALTDLTSALSEQDKEFKDHFDKADQNQQNEMLVDYLKTQLANALQTEIEDIDEYQPLIEMGIDSLMAVEFKNRALAITKAELPLVRLLNGANLRDVVSLLVNDQAMQEQGDLLLDEPEDEVVEGVI
ncbi:MAG: type I polyketide synthase [Pseudomonadales bacterium]|nr:type I polyketide synthase [Pseudomonadales bacterium]